MDNTYTEDSIDTDTESVSDNPFKKDITGANWVLHQSKGGVEITL
jgi:hypothetical protein